MYAEAGQRIHSLIQQALTSGQTDPVSVRAAVYEMWKADPLGGTVAFAVRSRVHTAVAVYLERLVPAPPWTLIGVEMTIGSARADLVWANWDVPLVVIDELKSGTSPDPARSPALTGQLERLCASGEAEFGASFVGVRLVPLVNPLFARGIRLDAQGRLVDVVLPAGMDTR